MKRLYFSLLFFVLISPVFSLSIHEVDYTNSYSSNIVGANSFIQEFSTRTAPYGILNALSDDSIYVMGDKFYSINAEGFTNWVYPITYLRDFVLVDDSIIILSNNITSLTKQGIVDWSIQLTDSFNKIFYYNNELILLGNNQIKSFDIQGNELYSVSTNCNAFLGTIFQGDLVVAGGNVIEVIDLNSKTKLFSKDLGSEIYSVIPETDSIVGLTKNFISTINNVGEQVFKQYFLSKSESVNTNLAFDNKIFACAKNGLYLMDYENQELFFSNIYSQYSNCNSIVLFDYNNDGTKEILFQKDNYLYIITQDAQELIKQELSGKSYFSISDLDNNQKAEIISFSNLGYLSFFETTSADIKVNLDVANQGFRILISNIGLKKSLNNNISLITPFNVFSELINLSINEEKELFFKENFTETGTYEIFANANSIFDSDYSNNNDSIFIESVNLSNNYGIVFENIFYDFNNDFSSNLIYDDINNDGNSEFIIKYFQDYFYKDNNLYYVIGDLGIDVDVFQDSILENESFFITGKVKNFADYRINNVSMIILANNETIASKDFNLEKNNDSFFDFEISNLDLGINNISVILDYDNNVFENNENNNFYNKFIDVERLPFHELKYYIDSTMTSLSNDYLIIRINNIGTFDENILIKTSPSSFGNDELFIEKGLMNDFVFDLNLGYGINNFSISLINPFHNYSKNMYFNLGCEFDSHCSSGFACIAKKCVEKIEDSKVEVEIAGLTSSDNKQLSSSRITSFVTADSTATAVYWVIFIVLLLLSSYCVYLVGFKLFPDKAVVIAIVNFIIFLGITYLFNPININELMVGDILLLILLILLIRRF